MPMTTTTRGGWAQENFEDVEHLTLLDERKSNGCHLEAGRLLVSKALPALQCAKKLYGYQYHLT